MNYNYSIIIQWSNKDNCFVASLPEWSDCNVAGPSYEQALAKAQEILKSLVESSLSQGKELPQPRNYQVPVAR